ncbi:hypothetical protein ABKN59_007783 [Abortiporus biennis]
MSSSSPLSSPANKTNMSSLAPADFPSTSPSNSPSKKNIKSGVKNLVKRVRRSIGKSGHQTEESPADVPSPAPTPSRLRKLSSFRKPSLPSFQPSSPPSPRRQQHSRVPSASAAIASVPAAVPPSPRLRFTSLRSRTKSYSEHSSRDDASLTSTVHTRSGSLASSTAASVTSTEEHDKLLHKVSDDQITPTQEIPSSPALAPVPETTALVSPILLSESSAAPVQKVEELPAVVQSTQFIQDILSFAISIPLPMDNEEDFPTRSGIAENIVEDSAKDVVEDSKEVEESPSVLAESEVPDPFLMDELSNQEEDSTSALPVPVVVEDVDSGDTAPSEISISGEEQEGDPSDSEDILSQSVTPADEISLTQSTILPPLPATPSPLPVEKPVPPVPTTATLVSSSSSDDEEEGLEIYLPGLTIPTMFLPIPNTDPLTTLLTKYISPDKRPHRDLSGDWQRNDFHTLVMTNSWRALARMARDRIVNTNPEEVQLILSLWYLRLSSLARLRLFNQCSAELTNLFTVLNSQSIPPSSAQYIFDKLLPFELEVLRARVKYWAGDFMGYLDELSALVKRCQKMSRKVTKGKKARDEAVVAMWKERGARVCLIMASQLIEMKDHTAAIRLLNSLYPPGPYTPNNPPSPYLLSAIEVAQDPTAPTSLKAMNGALIASAEGSWDQAATILKKLVEEDDENYVAINNLAVACLSQGQLTEGIDILETAFKSSPSTIATVEPLLFNLSTLYELRSGTAGEKKRELLIEVSKWAGDGLRATCLKMPTS